MRNFSHVPGFGEEFKELQFDTFWQWFVNVDDFMPYWLAQKSYLFNQLAFFIGAFCTFTHAMATGGRFRYLWLGTLLHGLVVEMAAFWLPDIDNYWHAQSPIDLLGRRLPLYILFLYPCFIYNASIAASKLKLPVWAEPFAVGMMAVMIDLPYDITAIKFVQWIWHDTDPNIYDRFYWVPWNSFYFHAAFAASFTFWFHALRRWFSKTEKWQSDRCGKELLLTLLAGMLGMPGGVLLFVPLYHPLHDLGRVHSENTFFMIFTIYLLVAWSADRQPREQSRPVKGVRQVSWRTALLIFHLICHYTIFMGINVFLNPEDEVAIGLHETVGNCEETKDIRTIFGSVIKRRKYLCLKDYDEKYYDFSCLPKLPAAGSSWYTVCGVPYENRTEYICIIATISTIAAVVMWNCHFRSSPDGLKPASNNTKKNTKKIN